MPHKEKCNRKISAKTLNNACKMVGVAVLIACFAFLPLCVFAVVDATRFQQTFAAQQIYVPIVPSAEDFYLLRMLSSRLQARTGGTGAQSSVAKANLPSFYLPARTGPEGMTQSYEAGTYALSLLQSMAESGAVPQSWAQAIIQHGQENLHCFYTSVDTLGLISIGYFLTTGQPNIFTTVYSVTVDGKTGSVISLFLTDTQKNGEENRAVALEAFVQQAGLSALSDWAVPMGTSYEKSGLYSKRGQALVTCSAGEYSDDYYEKDESTRFYYSMRLSVLDEKQFVLQDIVI